MVLCNCILQYVMNSSPVKSIARLLLWFCFTACWYRRNMERVTNECNSWMFFFLNLGRYLGVLQKNDIFVSKFMHFIYILFSERFDCIWIAEIINWLLFQDFNPWHMSVVWSFIVTDVIICFILMLAFQPYMWFIERYWHKVYWSQNR